MVRAGEGGKEWRGRIHRPCPFSVVYKAAGTSGKDVSFYTSRFCFKIALSHSLVAG